MANASQGPAPGPDAMHPQRLREVPLFKSLSDEELVSLSKSAQETTIGQGKILTFQNEYAYKFFVILEGLATVWKEGERLGELGPGDFFGEVGLLESEKRTATVASETDMRVIVLMGWDLRRIEQELPQVGEQIRSKLEERLDADRRR